MRSDKLGPRLRAAREHNQIALQRFPVDIWRQIFKHVFSWKMKARHWAWISVTCKRWNDYASEWKKQNQPQQWHYTQLVHIPEERTLGGGYPIYGDPDLEYYDMRYTELLKYRTQVLRQGSPMPPRCYIYPREYDNYARWWKRWGYGQQLSRDFAYHIWCRMTGTEPKVEESTID